MAVVVAPANNGVQHEQSAVSEFLSILEEHREECERNNMYVEAEVAQKRLSELRVHETERKKEAVKSRHIAEQLDIEEVHLLEIESFNERWNKQMEEYDAHQRDMEIQMMEKHQKQTADWESTFHDTLLQRPKFSKELLNLRRIEGTLAKAKEYTEAQKVKMKADQLEKWELEDLRRDWGQKKEVKRAAFVKLQQAEIDAFHQRMNAGRDKQKQLRLEKLNKLLKRYHNLKSELGKKQNLERTRKIDYSAARPSGNLSSTASSSQQLPGANALSPTSSSDQSSPSPAPRSFPPLVSPSQPFGTAPSFPTPATASISHYVTAAVRDDRQQPPGMMMPAIDLTTARSKDSINGSGSQTSLSTDRSGRAAITATPPNNSSSSMTSSNGSMTLRTRRSMAAATGAAVMGSESKRASTNSNSGNNSRRSTGPSASSTATITSGAAANLIKSPYDGPASARPRKPKQLLAATSSSASRSEEKTRPPVSGSAPRSNPRERVEQRIIKRASSSSSSANDSSSTSGMSLPYAQSQQRSPAPPSSSRNTVY